MSPILDLQQRHAELFRIRMGERQPSGAPKALTDALRVTSDNPSALEAITAVYGGTVEPWLQSWQAKLPTTELRVVVLPGDSVVTWWEQWRRKTGMPVCTRRCDGEYRTDGQPCDCPSVEARLAGREQFCQPTTRLSIMLPDVDVIGAGVLVSHGRIAAETIPQGVAVLRAALEQGEMVPATLRVVLVESSGRSFVVPRLEIVGTSLAQLLSDGRSGHVALSHGTPDEAPPSLSSPESPALGEGNSAEAVRAPLPPSLTTAEAIAWEGLRAAGLGDTEIQSQLADQPTPFTTRQARHLVERLRDDAP